MFGYGFLIFLPHRLNQTGDKAVLGKIQKKGGGQDYKTAVKWYTLAAEQGFTKAKETLKIIAEEINNTALNYHKGIDVLQDFKRAVQLFMISAELGYATAQRNLGAMYFEGKGVGQDYIKAHMWVNISALGGHTDGPKLRKVIAQEMTTAQINKAQELARECVARNHKGC